MTITSQLICVTGTAAIGYGLWQIYPPLTWLAVGGFVCWMGVLMGRKDYAITFTPDKDKRA